MKLKLVSLLCALAALPAAGAITTRFDVDLSPDAQGFAAAGAATLVLNYTIDGAGNVSLDAVAQLSNGNDASPARWNQVDDPAAGTVASAALYNTSFTLTFSGSSTPNLNYNSGISTDDAVLTTQGEGNATALEDGEFVAFTVGGPATLVTGFSLDLTRFSYDNRLANGQSSFGVEDTGGTVIEQLIPNTSLNGTIPGAGISLAAGETLTFRTISGNAGGAGLSGFEFSVSAVPEPSVAILGSLAILGLFRRRC